MAKKDFIKKSTLSLATFSLLATGLNANINVSKASLDLTTYSMVRIEFNETVTDFNLSESEGNFTIENNTTTDKVYLDFNWSEDNVGYYSVLKGIEANTDNNLTASDAVKKIRGNTRNNLRLLFSTDANFTNGVEANVSLLRNLGTSATDMNVSVKNNTWNLITIPAGLHTNAKEMIIANKATMIWGWDLNSSLNYNWVSYPDRMEAGLGYWVRTRIIANTGESLHDVMASDYNTTLIGDSNTSEVNTSKFNQIIALVPKTEEWVLLGNSTGKEVNITATFVNEGNATDGVYYFEDLLNKPSECYFVSIYHWSTEDNGTNGKWINDTENGQTAQPIPAGAGMWVKQRLCNK